MVDTPGSRSLAGGRTSTWGTGWIVVDTNSETSKVVIRLGKRRWLILDAWRSRIRSLVTEAPGRSRGRAQACLERQQRLRETRVTHSPGGGMQHLNEYAMLLSNWPPISNSATPNKYME